MNTQRRSAAVFLAVGVVVVICVASLSFVWAGEYWHTSHGPEGGDIRALAADSAGNLYAGVYQGWVFRGTVTGPNLYWTLKNYGFAAQARTVQCIALDASDDVYAGTYGGGVKRSTDDGDTWENITNNSINSQDVRTLLIDSGTLYAGTARGVNSRPTSDLTTTWSAVGSKWFRTEALVVAGDLYAGVEKGTTVYWGVYRLDGGSWNEMRTGLPADASVYALVADGDILYASASVVTDTITGYGVYWCDTAVTTTWQALGALPAGESRQVNALALYGSALYAGTENGVYEWSAPTWIARNTDPDVEAGQADSNAHRVRTLLCPASNTLYAGTPGRGVYRTADGGINWSAANGTPPDQLLSAQIVYAVAVNPAYDWRIYAGTQGGGLHRSPDGGINWERRSGIIADRAVFALAVTHPSGLPVYAGTDSGIYTTTNGLTWTVASNGLTSPESAYVRALAIDPVSSTIVYAGTGDGVYKTTNTGSEWTHQRVNPSPTGSDYYVYALAIDPLTPTIIYAGTQQHGVYRSTNAGATWADFNAGLAGEALRVNALTVDANHTVFAGVGESSGGIYERRVISDTWHNDVTAGFEPTFALIVNPITPTIVLAGTAGRGVLFYGDERYDPPNEWRELNAGLPNYDVYSLAIDDYVTQTLHAGTAGSGVWDFTWGPPPPPPPEMGITKDDGLLEVSLGQLITYTLHYANSGDEVGTHVVITEVIPTYTVFAYSDLSFHPAGGNVYTAEVGSMVGGASATSHFVVRVLTNPVGAPVQVTNYAYIRDDGTHGPDPREDNNQTHDTTFLQWVDLAISKTPAAGAVLPGQLLTYTIAYTNTGRTEATGIVLTEMFTGPVSYVDTGAGWVHLGDNRYQLDVASALAGNGGHGATWFTLWVGPEAEGAVENRIAIDYDDAHGPDITPDDNVLVRYDPIISLLSDLSVAKADGRTGVSGGDVLTYTITYTNAGPGLARGIVLTETIPDHTNIVNPGAWQWVSGQTYRQTAPDLGAGHTAAVSITVQVAEAAPAGPITNTVAVRAVNEEDLTHNIATDTDLVQLPDLVIAKTDGRDHVSQGDVLTYTITYTNAGPGLARGIVLTETVPDHTNIVNPGAWQWVSGQTYRQTAPDLEAGHTAAVSITVQVDEAAPIGLITNTVAVRAVNEADLTHNSATDTDLVQLPDLIVTKTDRTPYAKAGDVLTYTIAYTNAGGGRAAGIVLTETIPAQTTLHDAGDWRLVGGRTYTRTVANLASGASAAAAIVVQVNAGATGQITNTAAIRARYEVDLTYNTATDTDTILVQSPDLAITAFSDGITATTLCQVVQYTIDYANQGDGAATDVAITVTLPASATYVNTGQGWAPLGNQRYRKPVGGLNPGDSGAASISLVITSTSPAQTVLADGKRERASDRKQSLAGQVWPNTFTTQVMIGCAEPENQSNNSASDVNTLRRPDLAVTQIRVAPNPPGVAVNTTLYVTVANQGDADVYLSGCCHGFWTDLYVNPAHAPGAQEYSNLPPQWDTHLAPGSSREYALTYQFTSTLAYTLYAQINADRYPTIPESRYDNNTFGPVIVQPITDFRLYLPLILRTF